MSESENEELNHAVNIQKNLEDIIGTETKLKKRKKGQDEYKKELFHSIVNNLEHLSERNKMLEEDFAIDFDSYSEPYEDTIEKLLTFIFGVNVSKVVYFYVYERFTEDGLVQAITYNGELRPLNNTTDLYNLIVEMESKETSKKYH